MAHANRSMVAAFGQLNVLTTLFMLVFAVLTFVVTGLASEAITFLEAHPAITVVASLVCLVVIFASSNTRSPEYYHWAEMGIVFASIGLMIASAFLAEFAAFVATYQPVTGGIISLVALVAAAITGR
ncbi:hypothetical protein L593_13675 [Salinarchaeum sp. Harcht-Bsk1]|uniref:hypothetical protein n=1 Tax=Salinarchaeum sp. Harcht-Bsk1 TaxID=1333523 RepID=UPI00034248F8|nr:hypothetical protein [Salinarchaeum sp. Harcht-Bsk1]AGN02674.1 hypothetical protein L593_13675 [Salinarchaeum sp. Harcht-Bsk1]